MRSRINGYLVIIAIVLPLIVLDQWWALRRLTEYVKLQDQIISDYWDHIHSCDK